MRAVLRGHVSGYGEGFRILDQSASATGQGTAFAAQADDASAIHFNPGGMAQLRGIQSSLGTTLIGGHVSLTSQTGSTVNGDLGGTVANPPPTNVYLTANLKDLGIESLGDMSIGLGVTTPFGILIDYPNAGSLA